MGKMGRCVQKFKLLPLHLGKKILPVTFLAFLEFSESRENLKRINMKRFPLKGFMEVFVLINQRAHF
jgi:hypothetical protein